MVLRDSDWTKKVNPQWSTPCLLLMGTSSVRCAMAMKVDQAASITLGSLASSFSHSHLDPSYPQRFLVGPRGRIGGGLANFDIGLGAAC